MQRTGSQVSCMRFILSVETREPSRNCISLLHFDMFSVIPCRTLALLCIAIANFDSNCFTFTFRAGLRWFIALCK